MDKVTPLARNYGQNIFDFVHLFIGFLDKKIFCISLLGLI